MRHFGWAVVVTALVLGKAPTVQANDPVIDVGRLMSTGGNTSLRFYDQNARLMISDLTVIFRPGDDHNTTIDVVKIGSNDPVATVTTFPGYQGSNTVFGDVRPRGPGVVDLPGAGIYALNFKVGGKIATIFPFTVVAETSDDPFNPDTKYHYRGQWEQFIFLNRSERFTDKPIQVNLWASGLDVEDGGKGQLYAKLLKDGEVIARNKRHQSVNKRSNIWGRYALTLHDPVDNPNAPGFSFERLLADDDDYEIIVEIDGKVVRRFPLIVDDGKINTSPRANLDFEPRSQLLSPRTVNLEQRGQAILQVYEIFWLEAAAE